MGDTRATQQLRDLIAMETAPLAPIPTGSLSRLPFLPEIRVVAWDVYGTLLVSGIGEVSSVLDGTESRVSRFIERIGLRGQAEWTEIVGFLRSEIDTCHTERRAAGVDYPEVDIEQIWRNVIDQMGLRPAHSLRETALLYELITNPTWPMPEARSTLLRLKREGYAQAIVSNAQFYTQPILETLLGSSLTELGVEKTIWSFAERRAKPSPSLFEQLREAFSDISVEQILYVGNDMLNDVQAAASVGIRTALFAGDARSLRQRTDDPRVTKKPDAVLLRLSEIFAIVESEKQ